MIKLYNKDETSFTTNGIGVLDHDISHPVVEEFMNGAFTFNFDYPIFAINGTRIAEQMIVTADDPENKDQRFRILKIEKDLGMLTVTALHIFYDLNDNWVEDTNIVGKNGNDALNQMAGKLNFPTSLSFSSDIDTVANSQVVKLKPTFWLLDPQTDNSFINRWGGEIKRVNNRVWMLKHRGSDNGVQIRWRKNLAGYHATWDYQTIITRVRPTGFDGLSLPELYIDSPLIDKYTSPKVQEIKYEDVKAINPDSNENQDDAVPLEQALAELRTNAANEFSVNHIDEPSVSVSVDMLALQNTREYSGLKSLEQVGIWDTIKVINEKDGMNVTVRMNHYQWDPLRHAYIQIELGNTETTVTSSIGISQSQLNQTTQLAESALSSAVQAQMSADGKNKIYRGTLDPTKMTIVGAVEGDQYYWQNGDKVSLWHFDGRNWVLDIDDMTGVEVSKRVDSAAADAESAKSAADSAVNQANDAVASAGFAKVTADDARRIADSAAGNALDAATSATDAKKSADEALSNASGAFSAASQAINEASANGAAITSQGLEIKSTASDVALKADKVDVNAVKQQVTSQAAQLDITNSDVALKADKSTTDLLAKTIDSQTAQLTVQAGQIQSKADGSKVDEINNTVQSMGAQLTVEAGQIVSKADKSTVDNLTGTVNTLGTQVTTQAGLISAKLNSSDLDGLLNAKGFATQNYVQNQINITSSGFSASVSAVANQIKNLNFGARNLIPNGTFLQGLSHWTISGNYAGGISGTNESFNGHNFVYLGGGNITSQDYADFVLDDLVVLRPDSDYTLAITTRSIVKGPLSYLREFRTDGSVANDHAFVVDNSAVDNGIYTRNIQHFRTGDDVSHGDFRIQLFPGEQFVVGEIMLVEGNQITNDWAPAPQDSASVTDITRLDVKTDGINASVIKNTSAIADVQLKANGLQSTILDTKNGIQAQFTELSNQFTTTVSSIGSVNLIPNSGNMTDSSSWHGSSLNIVTHPWYKGGTGAMFQISDSSSTEETANTDRFSVKRNTTYTLSFLGMASANVASMDVWLLGRQKGQPDDFTNPNQPINARRLSESNIEKVQVTFNSGLMDEAYLRIDNNGSTDGNNSVVLVTEIQLEEGTVATPWKPSTNDFASETEVAQTRSDINLRVQKGSMISQLNLEAGRALLQTGSLILNADTTTFTGSAFIPNAAIKDLSANKITAGTIDANTVNLINLNANNITAGTINGSSLSINLGTGQVEFQRGRIHSADNQIDISMDNKYVSVADGDSRLILKGGQMQFVAPGLFDRSNDPYLNIYNQGGAGSLWGATFVARDFMVMSNSQNLGGSLTETFGLETFSGISFGHPSSGWQPTKIGGADRGVIISGGAQVSSGLNGVDFWGNSSNIKIGVNEHGTFYGNRVKINGEFVHIQSAFVQTTGASANLVVSNDGALVRSSSASKYKTNIFRTDDDDYGSRLLRVPVAMWDDKNAAQKYAEDPIENDKPIRRIGMIAEDLDKYGLEMLVTRGSNGELEGINYDRIGPVLVPVIARLKKRIEKLEERLNEQSKN